MSEPLHLVPKFFKGELSERDSQKTLKLKRLMN